LRGLGWGDRDSSVPEFVSGCPTPVLYRYRPASDEQYLDQLLLHNKVFVPQPTTFNDPFDCKIRFKQNTSESDWRRWATKAFGPKEAERLIALGHWKTRPSWADFQAHIDRLGVLSLSASPVVSLMWSHYASSHRGFCLRFAPKPPFGEAHEVRYLDACPCPDPFHSTDWEQIEAHVLTKAASWSYEQEWRFVDENGSGLHNFHESALEAVILGARPEAKLVTAVTNVAGRRNVALPVYRAVVQEARFDLMLEHIGGPRCTGLDREAWGRRRTWTSYLRHRLVRLRRLLRGTRAAT
jgi:hypothetical protein